MRFKTVRDILDFVRQFHARAAALFSNASSHTDQKKARWLLQWLARHERELGDAIARFEQESRRDALLDEWMPFAPDPEDIPLDVPQLHPEITVDDAMQLALALDNYLIRFYESIAQGVESQRTRDFFTKLLANQRSDEAQTVRGFLGLSDV